MSSPLKSWFWAIYLVVAGLMWVLSIFTGPHTPIKLFGSIFTGLSLMGVWGFLAQQRIGSPVIWRVVLLISFLLTALSTAAAVGELGFMIPLLLTTLLQGPMLLALYLYGFRSKTVWERSAA